MFFEPWPPLLLFYSPIIFHPLLHHFCALGLGPNPIEQFFPTDTERTEIRVSKSAWWLSGRAAEITPARHWEMHEKQNAKGKAVVFNDLKVEKYRLNGRSMPEEIYKIANENAQTDIVRCCCGRLDRCGKKFLRQSCDARFQDTSDLIVKGTRRVVYQIKNEK
jgi:hypothetical protein